MNTKTTTINDLFDIEDTEIGGVETIEKGPSRKQLAKIEEAYKDILSDNAEIEIEMDKEDKKLVSRIWKYIEKTRQLKKLEKDAITIASLEYADFNEEEKDEDRGFSRYVYEDEGFSPRGFNDSLFD